MLIAFLTCAVPARSLSPEEMRSGSQPANFAVTAEGSVSVKRSHWTGYAPVVFGTSLRMGDVLRVGEASGVKIICSDLSLHEVSSGVSGVPCAAAVRPLLRQPDGSLVNATRSSAADGSFPVVLWPRRTKLLSRHPILRWTPIAGVTRYRVIVRGVGLYWDCAVSSTTQVVYPTNAPGLRGDTDYKLIIETAGRSSASEAGPELGFSLLDSKQRREVEEQEKRVEQLGLPHGPTEYIIAHIYANHGLYAEAMQRLEGIAGVFDQPAVARLLGDLYLYVGLTREAESRYVNSLSLAKRQTDQEGEMVAHLMLAQIYQQAFANTKLARAHLEDAIRLASAIGDEPTAGQARTRLLELKK